MNTIDVGVINSGERETTMTTGDRLHRVAMIVDVAIAAGITTEVDQSGIITETVMISEIDVIRILVAEVQAPLQRDLSEIGTSFYFAEFLSHFVEFINIASLFCETDAHLLKKLSYLYWKLLSNRFPAKWISNWAKKYTTCE